MVRRRKLEEEIARTKDPVIRKQLQELLNKREHRQNKRVKNMKEGLGSLKDDMRELYSLFNKPTSPEEGGKQWLIIGLVFIGFFVLMALLAWLQNLFME